MNLCGSSWIFVDFCGSLWIFVDIASRWCSLIKLFTCLPAGKLCGCVNLCGSLWILLDLCGSLWIFADLCGYLWIFVDICGYSIQSYLPTGRPSRVAAITSSYRFPPSSSSLFKLNPEVRTVDSESVMGTKVLYSNLAVRRSARGQAPATALTHITINEDQRRALNDFPRLSDM